MSKTINCRELGGFEDCDYAITVPDDDVDMLVDTTVSHAQKHHPQVVDSPETMAAYVRSQIHDLYRQAHFTEQLNAGK